MSETIADIVAQMRGRADRIEKRGLFDLREIGTDYLRALSDLIEAEHKREIADEERISDAVVQSLRDKKLEMAGEIAAKDEEIAKLRECLKEAIREKCPFTRMSCKHGEPCEYECGTDKWRKALEGANDGSK